MMKRFKEIDEKGTSEIETHVSENLCHSLWHRMIPNPRNCREEILSRDYRPVGEPLDRLRWSLSLDLKMKHSDFGVAGLKKTARWSLAHHVMVCLYFEFHWFEMPHPEST